MKKILISCAIILIFSIFGYAFIIYNFPNRNIIVIGNTIYENFNDNMYIVNNDDEKLLKNKYKVYDNYNYLGDYYLQFDKRWLLIRDNGNEKNYDGEIIAVDENSEIKFDKFTNSYNDNDLKELKNFLNDYGISNIGDPFYQKFYGDFDNDGSDEKLVSANTIFVDDDNASGYSLLYIYDDGIYNVINFKEYSDNQAYTDLLYYTWHIFEYNNKYYCAVLNTYYGQAANDFYSLYELSDQEIKVYDNRLNVNDSFMLSLYYNSKTIFIGLFILLCIDIVSIILYNMSNKNNEI